MTNDQYNRIMTILDVLQEKADKAQLISPDDISAVISYVYAFGKPRVEMLI